MQGLHTRAFFAATLMLIASNGTAQVEDPSTHPALQPATAVVAEELPYFVNLDGDTGTLIEPVVISVPGATYIKVHFSEFDVPFGIQVEVGNPDGSESYRYMREHKDAHTIDRLRGDDGTHSFSAMSISGETAIVRIHDFQHERKILNWRVLIDSVLHGLSPHTTTKPSGPLVQALDNGLSEPEFACGDEERLDAACWKEDFPDHYDRSKPVAKLVTSRGFECTAWRVSEDNRLFTAEHCISSQEELEGTEIWFNYESKSCGSSVNRSIAKVTGNEFLASDRTLDYSLFTVNDFEIIEGFGNLGLDVRKGSVGENIFIPQHGLGEPRQISLESDMNTSGMCEIDDNNMDAYGSGTDIGYYCDTTTSSSGAPVISSSTGKVIALHHLGGCLNMGAKIALIWNQVKHHFGGKVPQGDSDADWAPSNQVPEANYQANCEKLSCEFDAADSIDADGSITTYSWDFGDGGRSSGAIVEHEFETGGRFPVSLTVEDNEGAKDTLVTEVSVTAPNQNPEAKFSLICIDNSCEFNGSSSKDPDGSISNWLWDFGDGVQTEGMEVEHRFKIAASYTVTLEVTDNEGASDKFSRTIEVQLPNSAPTAEFIASCSEGACDFDASASDDSDGQITSYKWNFGDGTSASGVKSSHAFAKDGTYAVELTVHDDRGKFNRVSHQVEVDLPNEHPVAKFTAFCDGLGCRFDASQSYDSDGQISAFNWSMGDGNQAQGMEVDHRFDQAGNYSVILEIVDNEGASSKTSRTINAELPNSAPVPIFDSSCTSGICDFDASSSTDSDGHITVYQWSFGDGSTASGVSAKHAYDQDGQYTVELTVTDNQGKSSRTRRTINAELPNQDPVARFTMNCNELLCDFDASDSSDSDGQLVSFAWNLGDGSTKQGALISYEFKEGGQYTVTLTVTDNEGASKSRAQTFSVSKDRSIQLSGLAHLGAKGSYASLKWKGSESQNVEILRNGEILAVVVNSGRFTDRQLKHGLKSAQYQVCEVPSGICSNIVTTRLPR